MEHTSTFFLVLYEHAPFFICCLPLYVFVYEHLMYATLALLSATHEHLLEYAAQLLLKCAALSLMYATRELMMYVERALLMYAKRAL